LEKMFGSDPLAEVAVWDPDDEESIRVALRGSAAIAPLAERDGNLLEGTVNPRSRHAEPRQIFVITHVDIDPQFVGQALPLLDTFVSDSARDPGVQTFALLSQAGTTNHFQLIEVFANRQAFDAHVSAQHTVDFRNDIQPSARPTMSGSISSPTGDVTASGHEDLVQLEIPSVRSWGASAGAEHRDAFYYQKTKEKWRCSHEKELVRVYSDGSHRRSLCFVGNSR
jgi:quinol monooxygenase YgiN